MTQKMQAETQKQRRYKSKADAQVQTKKAETKGNWPKANM